MTVEHLDTPVARIGREIRRFCDETNDTYQEVADKCNESLRILYPKASFRRISEDRIGKIVQAYQAPSAKGVAMNIDGYELAAIPHALKFSLDEVLGTNFKRCAMVWDPFADPEYSEKLLKLLKKHGENARELIGWAEFLPCSMETSEFMQAHHRQLFSRQPGLSFRDWHQLIDHYNSIGERRRALVLNKNRAWKMKQLMFVSDLMRIVHGVDEFKFDRAVRKTEIQFLADLIGDPSNRIELILAEDENMEQIKMRFRDCDTQFTIDDRLTVWRNHGGRISSSEDPSYITEHRATLEEFIELATYTDQKAVHDQLMYALEVVR
jgi:hypothetical protein